MPRAFDLRDVVITHDTRVSLLADICDHLHNGRGFALATLNLDHLVKLKADAAFRRAYAAQDMLIVDGHPVLWLLRLAGRRVELMPGSDMILPLCHLAAAAGRPVSILGSTDEALEQATRRLEAMIPGHRRGLLIAPPMGVAPDSRDIRAALARLDGLGPGLCFLALGSPKQERVAALGRSLTPLTGFVSVGAGVDFLAGRQRRAPDWVRAMAMEWAWRLLSAPRRLGPRYARCLASLPRQVMAALYLRRTQPSVPVAQKDPA